jgi:Domain of unknown function (DUF4386)
MSAVPPPPPAPQPSGATAATAATPSDPFSPGLQKLAASSGLVAALLILVAFIVNSAETPDFNAPAAEYLEFARDEDSAIKLSALLLLLSSFFLVFYAGVIRSALGAGEEAARGYVRLGFIVLAGFTFAAACIAIASTIQASGGAAVDSEPEVVKTYANLSGAAFAASMMGFAAALDAAGFIILRTRVFPVWLGWVALAGALFSLLTAFYILDVADDESIFGLFYPLAFLMWFIWLVATSILLIQRVGREPVHVQRYD